MLVTSKNLARATRPPALVVLLLSAIFLLFINQPVLPAQRSMHELWNFGHLVLFFVFAIVTCQLFSTIISRWSLIRLIATSLIISAILGAAIEYLQTGLSREASIQDWLLDIAGGLLGAAIYYQLKKRWDATGAAGSAAPAANRKRDVAAIDRGLLGAIYLFTVISCGPLLLALTDELTAKIQFPILADFNSPLEVTRFDANITTHLERGRLHVFFNTQRFAKINWTFFPRTWAGYSGLVITLHNPAASTLPLNCRIHDIQHETNYRQNDRFNRQFIIAPGQNVLVIPLAEVEQAPLGRLMDMKRIAALQCFTSHLTASAELIFKQIRLVPALPEASAMP